MALTDTLRTYRQKALDLSEARLRPVALLFLRIAIGGYFAVSGWGKIHHLDKVTAFFTELKIPMPHAQAILVSCVELFGGLALMLGLFARLAAIPMSATMVVAILTSRLPDLGKDAVAPGATPTFSDKLQSFLSMDELVFLAIFVVFIAFGPGALSLDRFVMKAIGGKSVDDPAPSPEKVPATS
jgi:putative oxidoreductase